jgi:GntR family transcriptional regulator/MocR family aminotransferase
MIYIQFWKLYKTSMGTTLLSDLLAGSLDAKAGISLQRQIYQAIQRAILDGQLGVGLKLPSSRMLATELHVSRITVMLAYDRLASEGYLVTTTGSGTFVADTLPQMAKKNTQSVVAPNESANAMPMLSARGTKALASTRGIAQREGAFVPGVADTSNFPFRVWQRMQNRYWRKQYSTLTGYEAGGGYLPLRQALADHLHVSRSVRCTPDQIMITTGTHQSLDLCARMLADPGDIALAEDPCHWGATVVLRAANLQIHPIPIDDEGICTHTHSFAARPKLVFVTPSHQYPTGVTMSLQRRRLLLEQAKAYDFWILEDDYDSEFRYDAKPLPSLQGVDDYQRVIYMGTFSKVMYPGLRLSYVVVPKPLVEAFSIGLTQLFRPGHLPIQAAMADFISEGHFARHIRRMRAVYAERQAELRRALSHYFGDLIQTSDGQAGLHLMMQFRSEIDIAAMTREAQERGVMLRPLSSYQSAPSQTSGFVLGYGAISSMDIGSAVRKMAEAYEAATGTALRAGSKHRADMPRPAKE